MKYSVIEAFCGAGGLSLGLARAGFHIRFAFDHDPIAIDTYRNNLSHPCLELDATEVTGSELLKHAGLQDEGVSVLAGGPPCQGFSIQRRGADEDPRNELLLRFLDWVREIKPTFFLIENVSGLRGKRGKEHLAQLCEMAKGLGYFPHQQLLNAADFGVPQIRKRVIIVGELPIDGRVFFQFPEPTHSEGQWVTVREAIGDLPSPPQDGSEHPDWWNHRSDRLSAKNKLRISYVPEGGGRSDIPNHLRLACHAVDPNVAGHRYVYGRLAWDEPAGTITARFDSLTRGKFGHPAESRTISLREGARLQGFPDDFVFEGTKVEVARQIGNAVPPPLAKAIGKALARALRLRCEEPAGGTYVKTLGQRELKFSTVTH
jgi:DNA (cytosine-5)-methyltransferase 1